MAVRMTQTLEKISHPFRLPGFDQEWKAGNYIIQHDEESIEGITWTGWHRTMSYIQVPSEDTDSNIRQTVPIKSDVLEKILQADVV